MVITLVGACGPGVATEGLPSGAHVHSLAILENGDMLLGLHEGLFRSRNGTNWELMGLQGQDAMVIGSVGDGPLFVAGHDVLARSDDGGATFKQLRPDDMPGLDLHAFAQAPADGQVLYGFAVGYGLFNSRDGGETWEQRAELETVPEDTLGLGVAGAGVDTVVLASPRGGVLRSGDGGRSFTRVLDLAAWAVGVDPSQPDRVWALTAGGLTRSDDAGRGWEPVSTLDEVEGQPVALAVSGELVLVVTEEPRALYRSNDGGSSWELVVGT